MGEKELIDLLIKNDEVALKQFLDEYSILITKAISYILKESQERDYIEECYDDVVMGILDNLYRFQYQCSLKLWVITIAKNKALDYKRKLKVYYRADEIEIVDGKVESAEEEFLKSEKRKEIFAAIEKLSKGERKLFISKFIMEKSTEELCADLVISPSTLYKRISRLKVRMQELINQVVVKEEFYE